MVYVDTKIQGPLRCLLTVRLIADTRQELVNYMVEHELGKVESTKNWAMVGEPYLNIVFDDPRVKKLTRRQMTRMIEDTRTKKDEKHEKLGVFRLPLTK